MSCKYKKKSVLGKKYCKCDRDNSVRKISCHCPNYEPTLPEKFKRFIHGRKQSLGNATQKHVQH